MGRNVGPCQIEQAVGDGPCITALREISPVVIDDVATDTRWPELNRKFADANVHSSLGVPLEISGEASAALNFFASRPGVFTPDVSDQNRCSQTEAMQILTKVSSNRNRKLRDVATELIEQLSGGTIQTHFDAYYNPTPCS